MLQLTAILHPAAQATSQAAASTDGVTNVAVLLAAGLLVVVLLRLVRVVALVFTTLATMVAALGGIALVSLALVILFAVTMAAHLIAR